MKYKDKNEKLSAIADLYDKYVYDDSVSPSIAMGQLGEILNTETAEVEIRRMYRPLAQAAILLNAIKTFTKEFEADLKMADEEAAREGAEAETME